MSKAKTLEYIDVFDSFEGESGLASTDFPGIGQLFAGWLYASSRANKNVKKLAREKFIGPKRFYFMPFEFEGEGVGLLFTAPTLSRAILISPGTPKFNKEFETNQNILKVLIKLAQIQKDAGHVIG